jgi:hypothetical protein
MLKRVEQQAQMALAQSAPLNTVGASQFHGRANLKFQLLFALLESFHL